MNRILFTFCFVWCFFFSTSSSLAMNPVIITKSKPGAAPADNPLSKDSNFYPNGIGLICKGTYTISQTFEPKGTGATDSQGKPAGGYSPYTVDKIEGSPPIFSKGFWTNSSALDFYRHIGNPIKALFGNPAATTRAFLSYDPTKEVGSFGAGNKSMPNSVLKCLRGQRLVQAVRLANGSGGGAFSNEQIAWDNGGQYSSVVDTNQDKGKKVQLDDIAISMSQNPYLSLTETTPEGRAVVGTDINYLFYNPDDNCFAVGSTGPAPTPGLLQDFAPASSPSYSSIPPEDAIALYKTLSPYDFGPSRRDVTTCSDDHGQEFDCQIKRTNMPRGGGFATSPFLATIIKPQQQPILPKDICMTNPEQTIMDKPNRVEFSVKVALEKFGEVVDAAKTFAYPLAYKYNIDPAIQAGISADETAMKNLIPKTGIDDSCISNPSLGFSSSDGKSFDPGNPCTRTQLSKWLLPKSQQNL